MAFMQKAMNKQRERAKQEATALLRELDEASAAAAEGDDSEDNTPRNGSSSSSREGGRGKGLKGGAWGEENGASEGGDKVSAKISKEARAAAAAEMAKALPAGTLQSSAVSMDARVRSSVASAITIDFEGKTSGGAGNGSSSSRVGGGDGEEVKAQLLNELGESAMAEAMAGGVGNGNGSNGSESCRRKTRGGGANGPDMMSGSEEEEGDNQAEGGNNPWLKANPKRSRERRGTPNGEVFLDVRKAAATALSAFSGTGNDGKASNGDVAKEAVVVGGGGDGEKDDTSVNGERDASAKGDGRSRKRKKRSSGGGGGSSGGKSKQADSAAAGAGSGGGSGSGGDGGGEGKGNKKAKHVDSGPSDPAPAGGKEGKKSASAGPKPLAGLSNDELVRRAFAAPDFDAEFKESKDDEVEAVLSKGREKLPGGLAGWGSWAGKGAPVRRGPTKRQVVAQKAQVCLLSCRAVFVFSACRHDRSVFLCIAVVVFSRRIYIRPAVFSVYRAVLFRGT